MINNDMCIVASRGRMSDGGVLEQKLEPNKEGITNTLTTVQKDNLVCEKLRIRKLTPKECWRLMGFDDEDFEKAEAVNSNTQLYKQAGNSIVVDVLEHLFRKLIESGSLMPSQKVNIEQVSIFDDIDLIPMEEFTVSRKYLRRIDEIISLVNPKTASDEDINKIKKLISEIIEEGIQDERKL